ncbi:uncharacterized protein BO80DRAFT_431464 [Aspergillus ibericus CBS 121593]|uniref:Uncharacterized protein n=1 Tax=Aspergillus ibericus CBS 121593 TaxID=1448316 RepID=A0A395HDJ7_9EURO|nr:hypothetical protein BO80DRAFT_431464 [Aspergillus ibericus CBS 121593]RAL05543.1 hypothetical protein BO80DRAFT_431464 [Aspergillus ibericus CBS 121593]
MFCFPFSFMHTLLWPPHPSEQPSPKGGLDRETVTKILRPLYLLFATSEAAEMHLETARTTFLTTDTTVYIPGDSSEMEQILKHFKAAPTGVKRPEGSFFSKTICGMIRGIGQCQNKVIYGIVSTILTWCIFACILGITFMATSSYVHNDPPTQPVTQGHPISTYQDLMVRAMRNAGIRYAGIRPFPDDFNGEGVLEQYQILGLKTPTTGLTFREVYVTHYRTQEIFVRRPTPGKTLWPGREVAIPQCDMHNVSYAKKKRAEVNTEGQGAIMSAFVDSWGRLDENSTIMFHEPGVSTKHVEFYFDVAAE